MERLGNIPRWATVIVLILLGYLGQQFAGDIKARLDKVVDKLDTISVSTATNTTMLNDHDRRLNILEGRLGQH